MAWLLDLLSWLALMAGSFCVFSGGLGLLRFPDFFSRMHAAGVMDTLGAGLILLGLLFQVEEWTVGVKLLLILLFLWLSSPTSSHALAKSAIHGGLRPLLGDDLHNGSQAANLASPERQSAPNADASLAPGKGEATGATEPSR